MPFYRTEYWANPAVQRGPISATNAKYGAYLYARSWPHAEKVAKARGMGEVIGGVVRMRKFDHECPSTLLNGLNKTEAAKLRTLHAISFLGYIAVQSEAAEPWEILGDKGLLHEVVHLFSFGGIKKARLVEKCREIERRVPGFLGPKD